jgi:phage tail sheath protein FI
MATTYVNTPGVQVKEVRLGPSPIAGVSTSIAGFVGKAPNSTNAAFADKARLITSADQFIADYIGNPAAANLRSTDLSRAVLGFFANGGQKCYVLHISKANPVASDYVTALKKLEEIDEITIIAAPGRTAATVHTALKDQAEQTGDRIALLDPPPAVADPGTLTTPLDSAYAAYYYPRVTVGKFLDTDPDTENVTPVGHIAGVYARVDTERGVHKAPANESIRGVLGVEDQLTDAQQNDLNPKGINVLRVFTGNVVIWGARTLSIADTTWRYINIRRLVNYIEESLQEGLRWAVFEPNTLTLRKQITRSVRDFLSGVWRDGGLFGETANDSFYVRFPDVYNTATDRSLGKLTMEVGLLAAYPAEFIIIRIGLLTQDPNAP